jgi:hypothetical protein
MHAARNSTPGIMLNERVTKESMSARNEGPTSFWSSQELREQGQHPIGDRAWAKM